MKVKELREKLAELDDEMNVRILIPKKISSTLLTLVIVGAEPVEGELGYEIHNCAYLGCGSYN